MRLAESLVRDLIAPYTIVDITAVRWENPKWSKPISSKPWGIPRTNELTGVIRDLDVVNLVAIGPAEPITWSSCDAKLRGVGWGHARHCPLELRAVLVRAQAPLWFIW